MSVSRDSRYTFTPPKSRFLRWLVDPGVPTSPRIASMLLGELFAAPKAVLAGLVNGLIVNAVALTTQPNQIFAAFVVLDIILVTARLVIVDRALRASRRGDPTPSTSYLLTASAWCALQGAAAFTAMRTNFVPLQLLAAVSVIGIGGPICARNYPAPRYAVMLVSLAIVPLAVGAAMTGEPWLLIMILQVPLFLVGALEIIRRFQRMAIATLQAEQSSYDHARHDALTGLLNRFGLAELEEEEFGGTSRRFVLFYLDLDGFKPINDRFGHKAGDTILRLVANRLKSSVRGGDVVARLGGDEFVIVASGMQPPAAETFSNRVVRVVSDEPYLLEDGSHVSIGISIGYACAPDDGVSRDDLHRKADAALYDAKAAGKRISKRFVGASITAAAAEPDLTSAISR